MNSDQVKVIVIGEANTGKSALRERFYHNTFTNRYSSTICGLVLSTQDSVRIGTDTLVLQIVVWDTAGQERFRALPSAFYRVAQGALLVYDVTNRNSFEQIPTWAASLRMWAAEAVAVLVGTKLDLDNREVSYCEGAQLAERLGVPFLETSAKSAINVDQAFFSLLALIGPRMGFSGRIGFNRVHKFP